MSAEQSIFSFELNETIHFAKGQEIADIKGISLEPNISIESYSDYISIRGVIELAGEYKKEGLYSEEKYIDFDDFEAKRYVERVTDLEENEAVFYHRFPVEISVPTYRIDQLDDVKISIDEFDYELFDRSQLNLFATILIHGINEEEEATSDQSRSEEEETELKTGSEETAFNDEIEHVEESVTRNEDETISNEETEAESVHLEEESREKEREEEVEDVTAEHELQETDDNVERDDVDTFEFEVVNQEHVEEETEQALDSKEENDSEVDRWPFKEKTQTLAEFLKTSSSEKVDSTAVEADGSVDEDDDNRSEKNDEHEEEAVDVSSLSDIFRNSEEESYTKMRICIVQDEDTIETIADRFEVSPLQLIKQNELTEDFDVKPGQLLYIPSKQS